MSRDSVYQQLRGHLAYLKLAAAAEALPDRLDQAHRKNIGHTEFLEGLLRFEVEATETRRWNSRMRFANFPTAWQLEDFDFSAQPSIDETLVRPEFGGCFAFCLVRGGVGVTCFHYIAGAGGWWQGLGDSGFVPGSGVCSDGGEGPGL